MTFKLRFLICELLATKRKPKTQSKSNTAQFFLARLLVLLASQLYFCFSKSVTILAINWPCFCFRAVGLTVCLMVSLVISNVILLA